MRFKPYHYQQYAEERIIEQPAIGLFLDMGMGKTVITLTAIDELIYDSFQVDKVLVIAPLRVAEDTWTRESQKWDHLKHLRIAKVLGAEKERIAALKSKADFYVINRENVEWLVKQCGNKWPFDMVVIDELSSFKSSSAKRFRALRKVRPYIKRIVGLTGTPAPNGLIDLWPQIYLLDGGQRLGNTITGYRDRYFNPGRRSRNVVFNWVPKEGAEEAIHKKLSDLCVSMQAKDYLELPERVDRTISVKLPPLAKKKYDQFEKDWILSFPEDEIVTAGAAAVVSNKLLQMANGATYTDDHGVQEIHNAKLDALEDIIEAANGKPVLVFYSYQHDKDRIRLRLGKDARILNDSKDIEDWNKGSIPVLLAHPASAGHGLNLQAGGHIIVWFGLTWSLELYQQANARLHRQGQTESVIVLHLVAEGTVDEDVMRAVEGKAKGQDDLLEAVKARLEKYRGVIQNAK